MIIVWVKMYKESTSSSPMTVSNLFLNIEQILYDINDELKVLIFVYSYVDN